MIPLVGVVRLKENGVGGEEAEEEAVVADVKNSYLNVFLSNCVYLMFFFNKDQSNRFMRFIFISTSLFTTACASASI